MPESVRFEPNTPVRLKLAEPEGEYDSDLRQGNWPTTDGRTLKLPRPATVLLYALEPRAGEEIQITKHYREHPKGFDWTVCLSPASEKLRAAEEQAIIDAQDPASLVPLLEASVEQARASRKPVGRPELVKRGPRKATTAQPNLFDRGTGTDGPTPAKAANLPVAAALPQKTKYPDMLLHICRSVEWALSQAGLQLGDGPKQDLISTVYIDAAKRSGVEYDFTEAAR